MKMKLGICLSSLVVVIFSCFLYPALGSFVEKAKLSRTDFPSDFTFGVASSAYQVHASRNFILTYWGPLLITFIFLSNFSLREVIWTMAKGLVIGTSSRINQGDEELMSELGVDSYRFSISWARIFPGGRGEIDLGGVKFYNELIDSLLTRGIQPFVILCHYDIPQALEDLYGGWLSSNIIDDFTAYADACFRNFGGRVKYWSTFNEPNCFIPEGYDLGHYPPGRCSAAFGCSAGNSATEPYIAAHNILRAHASAVHVYRKVYQLDQQGLIGIIMSCPWHEPLRNTSQDILAVQRLLAFSIGWFLDPIVFGEYPAIMRELVGTRLPNITSDLFQKLRGSYDFIGVNYYTTSYAADASYYLNYSQRRYSWDSLALTTGQRNGIPIGPQMWPPNVYGVPYGAREILVYLKERYSNPPIFITENDYLGRFSLSRSNGWCPGSVTPVMAASPSQRYGMIHLEWITYRVLSIT